MSRLISMTVFGPLFTLALTAQSSQADSDSLYAEAPPADAVFVRMLQETATPAQTASFAGQTITVEDSADTAFRAISATALNGVAPGSYYSLVPNADGSATVIAEPARHAVSKTHLVLVNTSDTPVRLVVSGPGIEVIAPVAPGEAGMRAVNPVTATLEVQNATDATVLGSFDLRLSRGQDITFVAKPQSADVLNDSFGPVLRF